MTKFSIRYVVLDKKEIHNSYKFGNIFIKRIELRLMEYVLMVRIYLMLLRRVLINITLILLLLLGMMHYTVKKEKIIAIKVVMNL